MVFCGSLRKVDFMTQEPGISDEECYIKGHHNEIAISPFQCPSLALLFTSFFGLGMTSFGGSAMTAYIRRMAVEQKWLDNSKGKLGIIV